MNGYRVRPKPKSNGGFTEQSQEERIFSHVHFVSEERAMEEWQDRLEGDPDDGEIETISDAIPYRVRWFSPLEGEPREEVVLLSASVIASSVLERYLHLIVGDHTLESVCRITEEEAFAPLPDAP